VVSLTDSRLSHLVTSSSPFNHSPSL
jgi:hypothetical protein